MPRPSNKILRRCLSPNCPGALVRVGGQRGHVLHGTIRREYVRIQCEKCGTINVWNPVGVPQQDLKRFVFVSYDSKRKGFFQRPKGHPTQTD